MKLQEVRMNITIDKMEYERERYYSNYFEQKIINVAIRVEFTVGEMKGEINIPTEEVKSMDEEKVIKYIYNYLNSKLERKFIDEV